MTRETIVLSEGGVIELNQNMLFSGQGQGKTRAMLQSIADYCEAVPGGRVLVLAPTQADIVHLFTIFPLSDGVVGSQRGDFLTYRNGSLVRFAPATSHGNESTMGEVYSGIAFERYEDCELRRAFLHRVRMEPFDHRHWATVEWPPK